MSGPVVTATYFGTGNPQILRNVRFGSTTIVRRARAHIPPLPISLNRKIGLLVSTSSAALTAGAR